MLYPHREKERGKIYTRRKVVKQIPAVLQTVSPCFRNKNYLLCGKKKHKPQRRMCMVTDSPSSVLADLYSFSDVFGICKAPLTVKKK